MADQPTEQTIEQPKKKKKGGCLKGCLIFFLILLLLVGALAAMIFNVPKKLGWVKPAGAKYTALTHERMTAEEIVAEAETKGFRAENADVYVFPRPDSGEAVIIATYDFSKSAALSRVGTHHPVIGELILLGGGQIAQDHSISHVALQFYDEEGNLILEVSASTADIRGLMAGTISEEEFREKRLAKRVDMPNYIERSVIPF